MDRRRSIILHLSLLLLAVACARVERQEDASPGAWAQFRGPGGLGSLEVDAVPADLDLERHLRWKESVPAGNSSPCVWGDRIYLTAAEDGKLLVLSHAASDGALIWSKEFASNAEEQYFHTDGSPATPTVCTDGERIYAYFGSYGLVALDLNGELVWEKTFPFEPTGFGAGSSPILVDGVLYLVRDVPSFSNLHAFDAKTGETKWTTPRPDAKANFSTPFVWETASSREIVVPGTGALRSYDLETGEPLWWLTGLSSFTCTSPTGSSEALYFGSWTTPNATREARMEAGFDEMEGLTPEILGDPDRLVAFFDEDGDGKLRQDELPPSRARGAFAFIDADKDGYWTAQELAAFDAAEPAPGRNVVIAVRAGGRGDVTSTHQIWEKSRGVPYVASPLLHRGRLYYVKKGGFLTSLDAVTGEAYYEAARLPLQGEYYASPIGVGDHILVAGERGKLFVIAPADDLEITSTLDFGEQLIATPAVADGVLYVRTAGHLWSLGLADEDAGS